MNTTENALSLVVKLPAAVSAVWAAWTMPERMSWFGSDPQGTVLSAEADVRLGGGFRVSFLNSDGSGYTCYGTYLRVESEQLLESTWRWVGRDHVESIRVRLDPEEGGTSMTFEHLDIDPQTTHGYAEGWLSCFGKLERMLRNSHRKGAEVSTRFAE